MSRSNNRPAPPDFTPGPWIFEPADRGDDSVGIPPTPPYIYAVPECDGNVYPVCMLVEPVRRAGRDPVDEYDECLESSGTVAGNAALIAGAPIMYAALAAILDPLTGAQSTHAATIVLWARGIARDAIDAIDTIAKGTK